MRVELRPVDTEPGLSDLLDLAISDATAEEVMPPVDGSPGWTPAAAAAFRDFHRARFAGLDGPERSVMYAIVADGSVAGMIRLSIYDDPAVAETGIWVGHSHRGRGVGAAALAALLVEAGAAGARTVVAETTPGNAAALGVLRRQGARLTEDEGKVRASVAVVEPKPPANKQAMRDDEA